MGKRCFDLLGSGILLLLLSPVFAFIWLVVRIQLGAPAIFRQRRPGLHGRPFVLYKFRSMSDPVAADGRPRSDEERLTPFGRFLRGSSLDELPELLNVLKGEMSLVGPRPLLMEYLPLYTPQQARRHHVLPGITGWAQIHGRNTVEWERKFTLDVWYVDHRSMMLDLRILLATVGYVLTRKGISEPGHATMTPFVGTAKARILR
jgi:sugar transferase EpsL